MKKARFGFPLPGLSSMLAILTVFIVKNRLIEKFGLIRCADSKKSLYSISGDIE